MQTEFERRLLHATIVCLKAAGLTLLWVALFLLLTTVGRTEQISEELAVKAIMGEASNQGYIGMLAVAGAIRNRGTLHGVYGVKAKHIFREPKWVWDMARKAWKESAKNDITKGSTHWENIKEFGKPYWADSLTKTVLIGDHQFYK